MNSPKPIGSRNGTYSNVEQWLENVTIKQKGGIYANLRGNSPIIGYEIEPTRIRIMFKGGRTYSYSYASAGENNAEQMKSLAQAGAGLSAFITRNVRYNYEW